MAVKAGKRNAKHAPREAAWPSARDIVGASKQIMADHFTNRDLDAVMRFMAPDLTWVGPLACQHARSAEDMRRIIEPEYGTSVGIFDDTWGIREVAGARVVVGTFSISIPQLEGPDVVLLESCTFVWALTPAGPRVVHLHVSSAYDVPSRIDRPAVVGEDGVGYVVDSVTAPAIQRARIRFDVPGGEERYVAEDRIVSLEAAGKGCTVVCDGGVSFPERERLVRVAERLPAGFVQTHRSCIVNARRVLAVRRFEAVMDDLTCRPIADRRYLEVAEAIERAAGRPLREG